MGNPHKTTKRQSHGVTVQLTTISPKEIRNLARFNGIVSTTGDIYQASGSDGLEILARRILATQKNNTTQGTSALGSLVKLGWIPFTSGEPQVKARLTKNAAFALERMQYHGKRNFGPTVQHAILAAC